MTKWTSEKELADQLRELTEKVRQLQHEIRDDTLASRRAPRPLMPIEDEARTRTVDEPPGGPGSETNRKPDPDR